MDELDPGLIEGALRFEILLILTLILLNGVLASTGATPRYKAPSMELCHGSGIPLSLYGVPC